MKCQRCGDEVVVLEDRAEAVCLFCRDSWSVPSTREYFKHFPVRAGSSTFRAQCLFWAFAGFITISGLLSYTSYHRGWLDGHSVGWDSAIRGRYQPAPPYLRPIWAGGCYD